MHCVYKRRRDKASAPQKVGCRQQVPVPFGPALVTSSAVRQWQALEWSFHFRRAHNEKQEKRENITVDNVHACGFFLRL